jgi:hypothetical protein
MVHIGYLGGDGFVIQDVWRTEAEMRSFDSGRSHARDSGTDAVAK